MSAQESPWGIFLEYALTLPMIQAFEDSKIK